VNKEPLVGVVYNFTRDEMFSAVKGKGATLNGAPIHVSGCQKLSDALVLSEVGHDRREQHLKPKLETWSNLLMGPEPVRGFRSFGSAAINLCMVASGSADVYYECGIHCWDIAAGVLILEEAGGVVLNPKGGKLDVMKRGVLASSSMQVALRIAEKIVEVFDQYPPDGH
jgi:myo-inositol-1(or 4)-monophosphatase